MRSLSRYTSFVRTHAHTIIAASVISICHHYYHSDSCCPAVAIMNITVMNELDAWPECTEAGKEMSDLYVKAVVGRGSFGLVKLVYHKRDRQPGHSHGQRKPVRRSQYREERVSTCVGIQGRSTTP